MATVYRRILLAVLLAACSDEKSARIPVKKTVEIPVVMDETAPSTRLTNTPFALTNQTTASYTFSGKDDTALDRFACRIDAGGWKTCTSPKNIASLAAGTHRFEVKAIDKAGNEDPTPATWSWTVDLSPPDTQLTAWPAAVTDAAAAAFSFSATDNVGVSGFECNRDGLGWNVCDSPVTYGSLATGPHSFQVRARDTSGNVDATPAGAAWTILLAYPSDPAACFTGGETPQLDLSGPDLGWTWNDPHVLKVGAEYWMYASATYLFDFPVRMYRLTSSDGIQWARDPTDPVLADAAPGAFDAGGLETPAVVFFSGAISSFLYDLQIRH